MSLRTPTRRWVTRGGTAAAALLAMAGGMQAVASAAPARTAASTTAAADPYSPAFGHPYRRGVVPTVAAQAKMHRWAALTAANATNTVKRLAYGGGIHGIGVTTRDEKVYLVFYGSQWGTQGADSNGNITLSGDPSGEAPYLQQLFKGLGTGGERWSGVMTQYCQGVRKGATKCPAKAPHIAYPHGGALAGVWVDGSTAAPSGQGNPTAADLGNEAIAAAAHFGNTTRASNRNVQYVILSPTGTDPDSWQEDPFCAWHDFTGDPYVGVSSPYGDIAFTNFPYVTDAGATCGQNFVNSGSNGALDGVSIVEGHEYAETITDQNPDGGWTVRHRRSKFLGYETADLCAWIPQGKSGGAGDIRLPTGSFAMQATWSNSARHGKGACRLRHAVVSTQLMKNPGFESRRSHWSATAGVIGKRSMTYPAHSGKWRARLDGRRRPHTDRLSQHVTIPAGYGAATFSFWLEVKTNAAHSKKRDTLTVQVLDSSGNVLKTLHVYSNRDKRNHYHKHSFSLTSLLNSSGSTSLTIKFTGVERLRHHNTAFLVDDAALNVS